MVRTYGLFRNCMEPYFTSFGVSGAQWGVLRTLHRAEDEGRSGLRLTDLGRRLLVRPPSVTTLIDRLERAGLVTRSTIAADLRARQVMLTPEGRQLVERILQQHPAQMQSVMAGLNEAEQKLLHRLLERLAEHLESLEPARQSSRGKSNSISSGEIVEE